MNLIVTILEQGLIYGIFITLDFTLHIKYWIFQI